MIVSMHFHGHVRGIALPNVKYCDAQNVYTSSPNCRDTYVFVNSLLVLAKSFKFRFNLL